MAMCVRIQLLILKHCWSVSTGELSDHSSYSHVLTPSDYHLFTCMKNWLGSQLFNNNKELMEGAKTWLSSQVADSFDTGIKNLFPDVYASISTVIMLRSNLSMYFF
jgi:hypothetical protein